jgi:hypothetical protein
MAKQISYSDISSLDLDNVIFQTYPKNLLSKEPAGRLEQIDMMLQMGLIQPDDGRRLLDFPDLKTTQTLYDSKIDNIETIVEVMMETKEFVPPDPMQDLAYGINRMSMHYLQGQVQQMDEERLDLLRNWVLMAQSMVGQAEQAQMAKMQEQAMMQQQAQLPQQDGNVIPMTAP